MVETKEKTIDGFKVTVTQFPARYGFKMQARLIKVFAPILGTLLSGKQGLESEVNLSGLGDALQKVFILLDENAAMQLVFDLMQSTRVDGQEMNDAYFDSMFAGKMNVVYKILGFILEVNFGNFFGEGGIGKAVTGAFKTPSQPVSQAS